MTMAIWWATVTNHFTFFREKLGTVTVLLYSKGTRNHKWQWPQEGLNDEHFAYYSSHLTQWTHCQTFLICCEAYNEKETIQFALSIYQLHPFQISSIHPIAFLRKLLRIYTEDFIYTARPHTGIRDIMIETCLTVGSNESQNKHFLFLWILTFFLRSPFEHW